MYKLIYSLILVGCITLGLATHATSQSICRPVVDCKFGTPDAIGWAMQNFFNDGSTSSWNFQSGAIFQENNDGTACLTGTIIQYGSGVAGLPARSFNVKVNFVGKSSTTTGTPETNNLCPAGSTNSWFYYTLASGSLTGVTGTATDGAQLTLTQHMMPAQYGIGAANQCLETNNLGLTGWFEWQVISQPKNNNWLVIMPYPAQPVIGQADICININGTPHNCGPVPPPCDNITNGGKICTSYNNGFVTLTNLVPPTGGTGDLQYIWLKSTTSCPTSMSQVYAGATDATLTIPVPVDRNCTTYTHNKFDDFNQTKKSCSTSLWLNVHTKLSGQLCNNGDYILFTAGSLTLNGICASFNTASVPDGVIVADYTVYAPYTYFDAPTHTWITRVPLCYSSSDIFITAGDLISTSGFCTQGGKSTILSGRFVSNKYCSNLSWFYGLAAYQPSFSYADVAAPGVVKSTGGGLQAGTPTNQLSKLVAGGSGGGGSNFTGSNSSTDKISTCPPPKPVCYFVRCAKRSTCPNFVPGISESNCVAIYPICGLNTALKSSEPVTSFEPIAEANKVRIDLETNAGASADYFKVQKLNSVTGNFETLEIINNTVSGNSLQSHSVYDNTPYEGDNYYQIEVAMNDGNKTLSEVKTVNFSSIKGLVLFPNPANDYIDVNLKDYKGEDLTIYLYNQIGVIEAVHPVQNAGSTPEHIDLNNLSNGQYLLRVESKGHKDLMKSVIIQK